MLAFVALQRARASLRGPVARLVARLLVQPIAPALMRAAERASVDPTHKILVDSDDKGFVGGYSGVTARTLIIPAREFAVRKRNRCAVVVVRLSHKNR